jgi:hypothetical protein
MEIAIARESRVTLIDSSCVYTLAVQSLGDSSELDRKFGRGGITLYHFLIHHGANRRQNSLDDKAEKSRDLDLRLSTNIRH